MKILRRQDLLLRAVFLLGDMETSTESSGYEPIQIDRRPPMPADGVTKVDIPLGLIKTSLRSRLCRVPDGRNFKD
jgi:hypothetical protein